MKKGVGRILVFLMVFTWQTAMPAPKISVVYCGIGSDLYSVFGHTGIRVKNGQADLVYNFGTFDPSTPNFLGKYIKGELDYSLSVEPFTEFLAGYSSENREIREYKLALTEYEAETVESELIKSYNGSSRFYRYQFLKNNCATKVFEIIERSIGNSLIQPRPKGRQTYRHSLNDVLSYNSYLRFGVNCLLGSLGEEDMTFAEKCYLPDSLSFALVNMQVERDQKVTNLVESSAILFKTSKTVAPTYYDYLFVLQFLLPVVYRRTYALLLPTSIGVIILILMVYSLREEFANNYNLLLFNPLDCILLWGNKCRFKYYLLASALLNLIYIVVFCLLGVNYIPLLLVNIVIAYFKVDMIYRYHPSALRWNKKI